MKFIKLTGVNTGNAVYLRKDAVQMVAAEGSAMNWEDAAGTVVTTGGFTGSLVKESPEAVIAMLEDEDVVAPK